MHKRANLMKSIGFSLLALVCLGNSANLYAESYSEKKALVDELYSVSNTAELVQGLPALFQQGFDSELNKFVTVETSPEELESLSVLREKSLNLLTAEQIMSAIRLKTHEQMSTEDISEMISWYRSDFGMEIVEIEKRAAAQIAESGIQAVSLEITDEEAQQREEIFQKIVRVTGSEEMLSIMMRGISRSMVMGMSSTVNQEMRQRLNQGMAELDQQLDSMQVMLKDHVMKSLRLTYQDLSNAELSRYADDLSAPAFIVLNKSFINGLTDSLQDTGYTLGTMLGEHFTHMLETSS